VTATYGSLESSIKGLKIFARRYFYNAKRLSGIMDQERKYCPNCYNPVEAGLEECPRCFTKISHNLENYLLAKYKIFTLIGVFGALSIYLLTTSDQNNHDQLLLSGSLFCLTIVIILSGICIWDLFVYSMKKEKIDFQNLTIWDIFRSVKPLPSILLFAAFFSALIFILTLFVLSNNAVNYTIVSTIILIAMAIIFISVIYYPYRYFIEKWKNNWFRAIIFVFLLFVLFLYIKNQITILPYEPISISLTAIISSILIILLLQCLRLMYRDMTSENSVTTTDETTVTPKRKTDDLTIENQAEPRTKGSQKKLNKWRQSEGILFAFALIIIGIALNTFFIWVWGDKFSLFLPFGYGFLFLGVTLIVNNRFSQKVEVDALNSKIEELSTMIDDMKK
jgi:hypothetical protein